MILTIFYIPIIIKVVIKDEIRKLNIKISEAIINYVLKY